MSLDICSRCLSSLVIDETTELCEKCYKEDLIEIARKLEGK